jgi:D-alanyl-lipoteichoic acid acyltransferase DltB (MBOAT superfamily)
LINELLIAFICILYKLYAKSRKEKSKQNTKPYLLELICFLNVVWVTFQGITTLNLTLKGSAEVVTCFAAV